MKSSQLFQRLYLLVSSAIVLTACNFPGFEPDTVAPVATGATLTHAADAATDSPGSTTATLPVTPQASPTPTPEPPPNWNVYTDEGYALSFYFPPGWDVSPRDDFTLDLHELEGGGWLEITLITTETAAEAGLDYAPGMSAREVMEQLYTALPDDGTFIPPYSLLTRAGSEASSTHGLYDVFEEHLFVGVVAVDQRAVLLSGHDARVEGTWEELYVPLYENILVSVIATSS